MILIKQAQTFDPLFPVTSAIQQLKASKEREPDAKNKHHTTSPEEQMP